MGVFSSLGVQTPFDPTCTLVTSHVFSPGTLAVIRSTLAVYSLTALIVNVIYQAVAIDTIDSSLKLFKAYSFLDPKKQGVKLAAYIVGIPAAAVVVFSIVWCVCWVRNRIWKRDELETYGSRDGVSEELSMRKVDYGKA
ncbi:hypothetical protein FRC10_006141 [Ceratobasidium sp. 414]|nr:hypothetical protein FRC10_006141 [Ceratobasidium sp. 414]